MYQGMKGRDHDISVYLYQNEKGGFERYLYDIKKERKDLNVMAT
jgi:hypothetical protein